MKKALFLTLFTLIPSFVFAQEPVEMRGDKALSFSFNNFNLNQLAFGVGGKYWLTDQVALNGSVQYERRAAQNANPFFVADPALGSTTGASSSNRSDQIGFSTGVERHFSFRKAISPYIGIQLGAAKSRNSFKIEESPFNQSSETVRTSTIYEVDSVFGVEYFFSDSVSLSGQYLFGYRALPTKTEQKFAGETFSTIRTTDRSLGFNTSSLILSVYF